MADEEIKQERKIDEDSETNKETTDVTKQVEEIIKEKPVEEKKEEKVEEKKEEIKEEEKKPEESKTVEEKKDEKIEKKSKWKTSSEPKGSEKSKNEAIVNGKDLPISMKHSVAICNFIRGKEIDEARDLLEKASQKKIPIPMRGEIPHKKGIMSGRYPISAINQFIKLIKSLRANALVNGIEFEKYKIDCKANVASRPYKRFGQGRFKRTHVTIKLTPLNKRNTI